MLFSVLLVFIAASAGLAWYLLAHDRGEKEPVMALWLAVAFGAFGALLAGWLERKLIPVNNLQPGTAAGTLLVATLLVGAIEEICKFLPLALFIYKKRYFNEHTDGIIYFALAGLGFGLPENILYTVQFGTKAGLARLLLTPLFHAAATGVIGYYLIKRKLAGRSPWPVAFPLVGVMLLHGMYDFGLSSDSMLYNSVAVIITLGFSAGLFWLYLRASEQDQDMGLSAVGHNAFCRACGSANTQHHLYCVHCGQHA